ncbi:MAG: hypothetical protein MUF15_25205 [Acidobacteria bacterium]|jgi:hypothetical protein|nr:hypothetical protein [Acidobacteriota bacterium]
MKRVIKVTLCLMAIIFAIAVAVGVIGYIFLKTQSPHMLRFSPGISEKAVTVRLEDLPEAIFIKGMNGCENLYLDDASQRVYVTDFRGDVHLLDGASWSTLKIEKTKNLGKVILGIAKGPDKMLYLNVCASGDEEWAKEGGTVWRISLDLDAPEKLTGNYQGINGLAFDTIGNLYFTSGNASILYPDGNVFRMNVGQDGFVSQPEVFLRSRHSKSFCRLLVSVLPNTPYKLCSFLI